MEANYEKPFLPRIIQIFNFNTSLFSVLSSLVAITAQFLKDSKLNAVLRQTVFSHT